MSNPNPSGEPVLCYVQHQWAYFTHAPVGLQWGDDWDDAPYEHNSGDPYDNYYRDGAYIESRIVMVAFRADLETPADTAGGNSEFSVDDINSLKVPWLKSPSDSDHRIAIMAGTPLSVFKRMIRSARGRVYVEQIAVEKDDE